MGPLTHGGWAGAVRSTSTGAAQDLASRNVPVASTGTALTPNTTATVTPTLHSGESVHHYTQSGAQTCNVLINFFTVGETDGSERFSVTAVELSRLHRDIR